MTQQLHLLSVTPAEHRCERCGNSIPSRRQPGKFCSARCRLDAWAITRAAQIAGPRPLTPAGEAVTAPVAEQAVLLPDPPRQPRAAVLRHAHFRSHTPVPEALAIDAKAARQDEAILEFFRVRDLCADRRWTPSEVHAEFPQFLLTSVRRSLTTMTARGLLVHHPTDRRMGPYGCSESVWSLRA